MLKDLGLLLEPKTKFSKKAFFGVKKCVFGKQLPGNVFRFFKKQNISHQLDKDLRFVIEKKFQLLEMIIIKSHFFKSHLWSKKKTSGAQKEFFYRNLHEILSGKMVLFFFPRPYFGLFGGAQRWKNVQFEKF